MSLLRSWWVVLLGVVLAFDDVIVGQCPDCTNLRTFAGVCKEETSCAFLSEDTCEDYGEEVLQWTGYFYVRPTICWNAYVNEEEWDETAMICAQYFTCQWISGPGAPYCYPNGFEDYNWTQNQYQGGTCKAAGCPS
jgi:hypothetical protein